MVSFTSYPEFLAILDARTSAHIEDWSDVYALLIGQRLGLLYTSKPPKEGVGQKGNVRAQGKLGVLCEDEYCLFWAHLRALYVPAHEKMQILTQLSKSFFRHLVIENSTHLHIIHEEQ